MPAACAAAGMGTPTSIPANDHIVVFLVDGMGFENLRNVDSKKLQTAFLTQDEAIDATFPTTTPVSLASLGTGVQPGEHGFVGATFELAEFEQVLAPLKWQDTPNAHAVQPDDTWFEKAARAGLNVNRIGPAAYAESGLTKAVLRGGQHLAAENLAELKSRILEVVNKPGITYAYYPKLDKTGHIYGVDSLEWRKVAGKVVDMIRETVQELPSSATLVVTADHGMLDITDRVWVEDESRLTRNMRLLTGEPRFRHVFAEPGQQDALLADWKSLEPIAEILTREEFIATNLMGEVADFVEPRIGDIVAIAKDSHAIASRTVDEPVSNLRGHHGSRTELERRVPFAVMAGYGRG
jgi:predicted AlkP superfamily pyrophosphatase or phosphodiesterase